MVPGKVPVFRLLASTRTSGMRFLVQPGISSFFQKTFLLFTRKFCGDRSIFHYKKRAMVQKCCKLPRNHKWKLFFIEWSPPYLGSCYIHVDHIGDDRNEDLRKRNWNRISWAKFRFLSTGTGFSVFQSGFLSTGTGILKYHSGFLSTGTGILADYRISGS